MQHQFPWWMIVAALVLVGCAVSEPEETTGNSGDDPDVGVDADADADVFDPCEECSSVEVCIDDECVDACEETGTECGEVNLHGQDADCGGCALGECNDGECPEVCDQLDAECGEVVFGGEVYDCGGCDADAFCLASNRCTAGDDFVDVAAGREHTCGIRPSRAVRCWGANDDGQLGDDNRPEASSSPRTVVGGSAAQMITTLNHHTCVVTGSDDLKCWGRNDDGQLGDNSTDNAAIATDVYGASGSWISAGGAHSCVVDRQNDELICWGDNQFGKLGGGDDESDPQRRVVTLRSISPDEPLEGVVQVGSGSGHSCALDKHNDLWCWGRNHNGQLGRGDTQDGSQLAESVSEMNDPAVSLSVGYNHSCALDAQRSVWCWGRGDHGQIGQEDPGDQTAPQQVELPGEAIDVDAGRFHSCAAVDSGDVYCWGRDDDGQAGQSDPSGQVDEPEVVDGIGGSVVGVSAGARHSCAVTDTAEVYWWGNNDAGQLGDESAGSAGTPVRVEQ